MSGLTLVSNRDSTYPPLGLTKPHVGGLVVLDNPGVYSTSAMQNNINHIMFQLNWSDIEPTDRTPHKYDWTVVEKALSALGANQYAKMGVRAGGGAPQWLRDLTGTVNVLNTKDSTTAACPLWWSSTAQTRWASLQNAMAARYDNDPRLKQVIACLAMANYMEPFILGSDGPSDLALWNAGLENPSGTVPGTQATAISTMLDNTLAAWQHTRVELPLHNTWEIPKGTGGNVNQQNWTVLRDFINPYESTYGDRIMFTDYGLGESDTIPNTGQTLANSTTEYEWMRIRGNGGNGPVAFQITVSTPPLDHTKVNTIVGLADQCNACYLEHSGYGSYQTTLEMNTNDTTLKTNAGI